MERESILCWIERLKSNAQALIGDCRSLKSHACGENGQIVDALLDALVMDSEKHQRFLLAVETAIENIMMSRLNEGAKIGQGTIDYFEKPKKQAERPLKSVETNR